MSSFAILRHRLLELHRALIEAQRLAFEKNHGVLSASALLDRLINHSDFAWLKPMTTLIVEIDEMLDGAAKGNADEAKACIEQLDKLFGTGAPLNAFQTRFYEIIETHPDIAALHATLTGLLKTLHPSKKSQEGQKA